MIEAEIRGQHSSGARSPSAMERAACRPLEGPFSPVLPGSPKAQIERKPFSSQRNWTKEPSKVRMRFCTTSTATCTLPTSSPASTFCFCRSAQHRIAVAAAKPDGSVVISPRLNQANAGMRPDFPSPGRCTAGKHVWQPRQEQLWKG